MVSNTNVLPAVSAFLSADPVRMFMGGQWVEAVGGGVFESRDPGSGAVLARVAEGRAEDVDLAVAAARKAFVSSGWATMPANERAVYLHRLADLIDKHADELAQVESLDVGKPLAQAAGFDVPDVATSLRWYADLAVHTRLSAPIAVSGFEAREVMVPCGVAAFILPWNFPQLLVGWNMAPALAAGNTVIIKPAEDTPLGTLYLCKLVEAAGIPAGVVNVVTGFGEVAGKALASHEGIDRMGFTGSPEVGRLIGEACGRNLVPVKLELGGKGAAVLFDDVADVDAAVEELVGAITLNAGQVCCTASRWVIHESLFDRFAAAAKAKMQAIQIGHGMDPATQMGPVVSPKQMQRVLGYLDRGRSEGATAVLEGGPANVSGYPDGTYVKPALLTGQPDNICAREEIFGPVAYLMPFQDEAEAIALVNRLRYGLANSVWSADLDRANRVAEKLVAANSWINGHNLFPHGVPYGGCNLSGMGGGVLGARTLFDYLRYQSIVRRLP